jgi:hypothetical protein
MFIKDAVFPPPYFRVPFHCFQKSLKYLILKRFIESLLSGLSPLNGMKIEDTIGPGEVLAA